MPASVQLQRDVQDELQWEPSIDAAGIGVMIEVDGVVTLSGHVPSFTEKMEAERVAKRVRGVKAVANAIEVRLPGKSQFTDAEIARAALSAMEWDTAVPHERVQVIVSHGHVRLEGDVDWEYQRRAAEKIVRHQTGVQSVTNMIAVKAKLLPEPAEVKTWIEAAFRRSAELDAQRIRVETHDGKVILKGDVHSWAERQEAERTAWAAPGVTRVENLIAVTPGVPRRPS